MQDNNNVERRNLGTLNAESTKAIRYADGFNYHRAEIFLHRAENVLAEQVNRGEMSDHEARVFKETLFERVRPSPAALKVLEQIKAYQR
jgi:polyhydroxyalkanoate synthesis regulator phasin